MEQAIADKVLNSIDREKLVQLEQAMVRIPSPTYEEGPLADYLATYMQKMGLEVEIIEVEDHTGGPRRSRQPLGWLRGQSNSPLLMFNGHMDHNPVVGEWDRDPFSGDIEDGWIFGRGSQDEKGGIAAMISAADAIRRSGLHLQGSIVLAPVMGHKYGGLGTRILTSRGIKPDLVINTENSGNGIAHACVGVLRLIIQIFSKPLHFHSPADLKEQHGQPIEQMAAIIQALGPGLTPIPEDGWLTFEPHPDLPGYPQLRMEVARGQNSKNDPCQLEFQIRTVPGQTADTVRSDLERLLEGLKEADPRLRYQVEVPPGVEREHYGWDMPAFSLSRSHPLVQVMAKWHEHVTGKPPEVSAKPRIGAVGDGNLYGATGIPTILYGPGDIDIFEQWPTPNERVLIEDIVVAAKTMALTAVEMCGVDTG